MGIFERDLSHLFLLLNSLLSSSLIQSRDPRSVDHGPKPVGLGPSGSVLVRSKEQNLEI